MKIGIDLRSLQSKQHAGIGRYVRQLCEELVKLDRVNEYFFYFNTSRSIKYPDFTKHGTVVHSKIPARLFNLSVCFLGFPDWDKQNNLDVFWQPSFNFLSLSNKVKKVLTVHDLSWMINKKWYNYKMLLWHGLQNIEDSIKSADKIVAVSKSTAADLDYFFDTSKSKIKVVYSGINKEIFNKKNVLDIDKLKRYLLFVGTLEPRKNVLGIIRAMDQIYQDYPNYRNVKFVIIGAKGWSNKAVHKAIKQSQYRSNYFYVGYATNEVRDYYIKYCQALVWPSFYEGFGHPPLETLWRGRPVIAGNGSSLPEVLKNNALLVDPYNCNDLQAAILEVLHGLDINYDKESTAEYDWHKAAKQYLEIFNSLSI